MKRLVIIDLDNPLNPYVGEWMSPTVGERFTVYRLLLTSRDMRCKRYNGMCGILRLLTNICKKEMMSLFRRSQQMPVTRQEKTESQFEAWRRAISGEQNRPQCLHGSDAMTASSLRSSSSDTN